MFAHKQIWIVSHFHWHIPFITQIIAIASKFLDIVFKMRAQDFLAGEEDIVNKKSSQLAYLHTN